MASSPRAGRRVGRASTELQALLAQVDMPGGFEGAEMHGVGLQCVTWGCNLCLILLPAGAQKEQLLARLSQRSIARATPAQPRAARHPPGRLAAWSARMAAVVPASKAQLRLGLQFLVCFWAVMFLQIGDASYNALKGRRAWYQLLYWGCSHQRSPCCPSHFPCDLSFRVPSPPLTSRRPIWALTVVVVLFESTAGSSVRKGLMRLAGTLAGAAAGIAIYYFVRLCNGLSLADHPQKFILTPLLLALACGVSGAAAARTPAHTYMQVRGPGRTPLSCRAALPQACTSASLPFFPCADHFLYSGLQLLPGALQRDPCHQASAAAAAEAAALLPPAHVLGWMPLLMLPPCPCCRPLWQVVMALIGISIHALVVSAVLPVTSHTIVQRQFAAALGQLATVAEQTVIDLLPADEGSQGGSSSRGSGCADGDSSGRGSCQSPPPAPPTTTSKGEAGSHPSSPRAANGAQVPPSAFQPLPQPAPVSPPASPLATPPGTPPVRHANRRRLALEQQSSLIALPPEPSTVGGGSRREAARALRQLHEPQGPALAQEAEALLGCVYSRLLRRSWQVGGGRQPHPSMVHQAAQPRPRFSLPSKPAPAACPAAGQRSHCGPDPHHQHAAL